MRYCIPTASIEGADHDIIYSVDIQDLIEAGMTETQFAILRNFGWDFNDDYMVYYV